MAIRQNTLLIKRSNVIDKIPPLSGLTLGEIALNTADAKLYSLYTSGSVTPSEVRQIGWDRISRTGDTVTGDFNFFGDVQISGSSQPTGYALSVTGDTNFDGDVYVQGDLFYSGSVIITGSTIIEDGLTANTIYTDYIDFNVTPPVVQPSIGRLSWNIDDKTLEIGTGDGDTALQIGQETVYPPVVNSDSIDLVEGTLVMIDPNDIAQGNRIRVVRMVADGTYPAQYMVGVLTEDIPQTQEGFATWFGYVRNLNRNTLENNNIKFTGETWSEGDVLYPSPTLVGGLTNISPSAPNIDSTVAVITAVNGVNITLLVRPTISFTLTELTNVRTTGLTDGDIIVYNSDDSVWESTKTLRGDYVISGNTTQSGNTTTNGTVDIIGSGTGCTLSVTGKTCLDGNLIVTGSTIISSGLTVFSGVSADFINITTTPTENNDLIQILGRNSSTGLVEYRDVKTIGNNITIVTGSTYSATTTDDVIGIDSSTNTVTLYLPDSVSSGRLRYDIKDIGVNSFVNPITVQAAGSDTIITTSVVSSFELSADGGAVILVNTGTGQWWQM
jgi:hypothetical protein